MKVLEVFAYKKIEEVALIRDDEGYPFYINPKYYDNIDSELCQLKRKYSASDLHKIKLTKKHERLAILGAL